MSSLLAEAYERLLGALGPQRWWPGDSPFEVVVGAVLVQNTAWQNVERAIENLREAGVMEPHALYALAPAELAELIRPAGYYQLKARRLRNLLAVVVEEFDGSLETMFRVPLAALRERLLAVNGVGPETADAILLYAGGLATFVVDAYTHRIAARHGWVGYDAGYHEIKEEFESGLPADVQLYNEYHALLVRVGKDYCRRAAAKCEGCPLAPMLPESGVVQPFA
jgi:endonuclease-3 related protein